MTAAVARPALCLTPARCAHCGLFAVAPDPANAPPLRIVDLEAQVRQLTLKAAASADRMADYEDEVVRLRHQSSPLALRSRLTASPSTTPSAEDLLEALNREQTLRLAAERRLSATSAELEDLSAALFTQANSMVADERRVRARLEERVQLLERRDAEKRRRLDRLELAVTRIGVARALLLGRPSDMDPTNRPLPAPPAQDVR